MANGDLTDQQRVEITVAVRDEFSTAMKEFGRLLDAANRKALDMGATGGTGLRKFAEENSRANVPLANMSNMFMAMSKTLMGPVGLVAGFAAATKALVEFATQRTQLYMFAASTRLAADDVLKMTGGIERMGYSTGDAKQAIGSLATAFKDIGAHQYGSEFYRSLAMMPNGLPWAEQFRKDMSAGGTGVAGAIKDLAELIRKSTPEAQYAIGQIFHVDPGMILRLEENMKKVKRHVSLSPAEAQELVDDWADFWDRWYDLEDQAALKAFRMFEEIKKKTQAMMPTIEHLEKGELGEALKHEAEPFAPTNPAAIEERDRIRKKAEEDADKLKRVEPFSWRNLFRRQNYEGDTEAPAGARFIKFSPENVAIKELSDTEEDSNRVLKDIRDLLSGEGSGTGGGAGDSGYGGPMGQLPGMGRGTAEQREAYNKVREAAVRAGSPNPDLTASIAMHESAYLTSNVYNRTNNPFGQTKKGGGYASYSSLDEAVQAHVAQWGSRYGGGSIDEGIQNLRGAGYNTAHPGWGPGVASVYGQMQRPVSGEGGGAIPSDVLEVAKKAALTGGPGAVFKFIREQGYNVDSRWCGDFAAAVISAAGGRPPRNPAIASNWRNYGYETMTPGEGDIAVRRGPRTGAPGSHVTIVSGVGDETFTGIGGNQGRAEAQYRMRDYQFFRDSVDKQMAKMAATSSWEGAANIEVDFKNVPPGVRTGVEQDGFKTLKISRAPQAPRAGGETANYNQWAYE